jgi:hypothetical protein
MQQNIICRANPVTFVDTHPEYSHQMVIKEPLKRLGIIAETTRYLHICSRPNLPSRFNNFGGNPLNLYEKLRLIAYVLVFLHASLAVFCLNAGFVHAQNTIQASASAQAQEKPQITLTPAEQVWLAQNHTVRVRVFYH